MLIEAAIAKQLLANTGVATLVGTRIYPVWLPQGCTYPAISYLKVSGSRVHTMGASEAGANPRVQISCWGRTYADVKSVASAVRAALDQFSGTLGGAGGVSVQAIQLDNELDLIDPNSELYHVPMDFLTWYTEA